MLTADMQYFPFNYTSVNKQTKTVKQFPFSVTSINIVLSPQLCFPTVNMFVISEFFYPEELKKAIADLRESEDLNEAVIDNFSHDVFGVLKGYCGILMLLVLLGIATNSNSVLLGVLILLPVFVILCIIDINRITNICRIFALGRTADAHLDAILKKTPSWALWAWSFKYSYTIEGKNYRRTYNVLSKYLPQKPHDTAGFRIIYNPKNPEDSMPLLPELERFNPKLKRSDK